jgi:hypothetical protein
MNNYSSFENIYDKYCPMLYSIALQICGSKKNAEELLTSTFTKLYTQEKTEHQDSIYCLTIIRLMIKTASELYPIKLKNNFRLKQFENTPLLNQLICNQINLQDYCKEKYLTLQEGMHIIRTELNSIKLIDADSINSTKTIFL